jgi:hypothetical protein
MRHPIKTNRLQRWLAKISWLCIVLIFFISSFVIAWLCSAANTGLAGGAGNAILAQSYQIFLSFCGVGDVPDGVQDAIRFCIAVLKVVLPTILLGAAVYKISIPSHVHIARKKLTIGQRKDGSHFINFRSYNASGLIAVSLKFEVFMRRSIITDNNNHKVDNVVLKAEAPSDTPPVMLPWVPHSVIIPLVGDDVLEKDGKKILQSIQGNMFSLRDGTDPVDPGDSYLLIVINGSLPRFGSQYIELSSFRVSGPRPEYEFGDFTHIDVLPPKGRLETHEGRPEKWKGWDRFDKLASHGDE